MANSIKEIMTDRVVTVATDTALLEAVDLLLKRDFNGLPVVDKHGFLVGIVTDEDLIIKGSSIHLPTFLKLMRDFQVYKKDASSISEEIKAILKMQVKDVMNSEPFTLRSDASIVQAIDAFTEHHRVNPIPVVDARGRLAGVVSRYDVIKLYGLPRLDSGAASQPRQLDMYVNRFLSDFGRQFVFVDKTRTRLWLATALLMGVIGFLAAFVLILRII